jgi:hypothetical protein
MTISASLIILVKKRISALQNELSSIISLILSFCTASLVALTNTLMGMVIRKFAMLEEHKKTTTYFVSVGKKLNILFMVNMILTTLIANLLSGFEVAKGLFNDFFFLFLTNTYLSSLFSFFDIVYGIRLFRRYLANKKQ